MAFFQLEPWGGEIENLRMGIMTSSICNAVRTDKGKPYKPKDFMPTFEREAASVGAEPDMRLAKARFAAWNGMHDALEEKRKKKEVVH